MNTGKQQISMSDATMTKMILSIKRLSPAGQALQEAFKDWDDEHKAMVIKEIKRIIRNFDFAENFGIFCAIELLAIYIAHKEGWRTLC